MVQTTCFCVILNFLSNVTCDSIHADFYFLEMILVYLDMCLLLLPRSISKMAAKQRDLPVKTVV